MQKAGINVKDVKSVNRGLVLQYLATADHPLTRSELTERTGLSKMTVSNIVGEFLSQQLIEEEAKNPAAPISRSNPILLQISPHAPKLIGVRIRHHSCMASLCDLRLRTISTKKVPLDSDIPGEQLLAMIRDLIAPLLTENRVIGIGIGSIGPVVNSEQGIVLTSTDFYSFQTLALREYLERQFHIPVFVEHTSSCAILAEQMYGSAKSFLDFTHLSMASGFNLGIIANGQLQSSRTGLSGEIGHICISIDGPTCYCGNRGCLETFVTVAKLQQAAKESPLIHQEMTFAQLCENSEQPAVHHLLMRGLIDYLIIAMTNIAHLLNPEAIYLGDELARLPIRYVNYLEQELNNRLLSRNYRYIKILLPVISTENTAAFCAITVLANLFKSSPQFE